MKAAADAAARRALRAQVAQRLHEAAPQAARALDWAALDAAPLWLALSPSALALWCRRVGAVLAAPALRLLLTAAPLRALHGAVGADWTQALLAQRNWPAPPGLPWTGAASPAPAELPAALQGAGAAVLLAALPHGALRHAAAQLLEPASVGLVLPRATADAVLDEAWALQRTLDGAGA